MARRGIESHGDGPRARGDRLAPCPPGMCPGRRDAWQPDDADPQLFRATVWLSNLGMPVESRCLLPRGPGRARGDVPHLGSLPDCTSPGAAVIIQCEDAMSCRIPTRKHSVG